VGFFQRYRFWVIAVSLLLGALIIFSLNAGKGPGESRAGRLVLEVIGPVQRAVSAAGNWLDGVWRHYFNLVHAARENDELKDRVAGMRQDLTELQELKLANRRLRSLLNLEAREQHPTVAAEIVGVDPSSHFRTAIINRGTRDGVKPRMPVIQHQGVVGRVIWASPNYAKVLLLIDPNAAVDVLVQRSRVRGVVEGAGSDTLRLKYVLHNDKVIPGDVLVCTGAAGVFPKGTLVGRVRSVEEKVKGVFLQVDVEPAVDFSRLEEVLVILRQRSFDEDVVEDDE
jgi:rod shape-determining protein MreC